MTTWLDLSSNHGGWSLIDTGRLRQITQGMSHPATQHPAVVFFIGKKRKVQALKSLFPYNNITRQGPEGVAKLHLSSTTDKTSHPVFVIDGSLDLLSTSSKARERYPVPVAHRHHVRVDEGDPFAYTRDVIYTQLLFPFTHVLCLFADDLGGLARVREQLTRWSSLMLASNRPCSERPRVVIVVADAAGEARHAGLAALGSLPSLGTEFASEPLVLDLRDRHKLSPSALFYPLHMLLLHELDLARIARVERRLLFSAVHFDALFQKAAFHVARNPHTPFNCILAARQNHPVDESLEQHLRAFIAMSNGAGVSESAVTDYVASALLMDGYPPGMHGFEPEDMFRQLYARHCRAAWDGALNGEPERQCQAVERRFATLFTYMTRHKGSAEVRKDCLERCALWSSFKSTTTCLFCLRRPPEHILPCGHALCEVCVCIFGTPTRGVEYRFDVTKCILCAAPSRLTVRLLPPTKRPRILVLDGGGIRALIHLGFLRALQRRRRRPDVVRDVFNLTVGTSGGSVNLSELVLKGSPISEAILKFKTFARQIFSGNEEPQNPIARGWKVLTNCLNDSRYDSTTLEVVLQKAFGTDRRLFDTAAPMSSGTRVAMTASRILDGRLCIFTNYRGQGRGVTPSAYQALVPREAAQEPFLWEVVRCSVAAPSYFLVKYLQGFGTFQDGGVRANNPLTTARRESTIIWPAAERPDLIVSIGTGFVPEPPEAKDSPFRGIIRDGFIPRLIRALLFGPAMDGQQAWQDALDTIPADEQEDIFRLDQSLTGTLPELDNVDRMEELSDLPYTVPDELVRAFVATEFFLELDEMPLESNGIYRCRGSILCDDPEPHNTVADVLTEFPGAQFAMVGGGYLGSVVDDDGCKACGYYRKRVLFEVPSLDESISLVIDSQRGSRRIGGLPASVNALLTKQQADAAFGRPDHRSDRWPPVRACYCSIGHKRRVDFVEPAPERKKRRL